MGRVMPLDGEKETVTGEKRLSKFDVDGATARMVAVRGRMAPSGRDNAHGGATGNDLMQSVSNRGLKMKGTLITRQ